LEKNHISRHASITNLMQESGVYTGAGVGVNHPIFFFEKPILSLPQKGHDWKRSPKEGHDWKIPSQKHSGYAPGKNISV